MNAFCPSRGILPRNRNRAVTRTLAAASQLALVLTALCGTLNEAFAQPNSLDSFSYATLPGNKIQLKLKLAAPPAKEPLSFTIDNPARIALDFADTQMHLPNKTQTIGIGNAQSVTAVEASGRTRVVLNMTHLVPYDVAVQGDTVTVNLDSEGGNASSVTRTAPTSVAPVATARLNPAPVARESGMGIETVDFRRGDHGEGRITIKLSKPTVRYDIKEVGGKIVVDFLNTRLPEHLNRRLDVTDFATPVKEVDTKPAASGVRMAIAASGSYEHMAYQSDNMLTIEVKPLTKSQELAARKDNFTGERLSLNFQNIEVRAVLQLIADFTGLNMVASDGVAGSVTLRLKNVPWDQALDIILRSKGLGMRRNGNVIMVAPQDEISSREKLELEAQKQLADLAPVHTEFAQVNYAKATDIAALLKAKENKLVSDRGNVTVDDRTNTLLIQDTDDKLAEIRKVIASLDIPVRQVLIESRLVIANQDFTKQLGVKFGYSKGGDSYMIGGKRPGDTAYTTNGSSTGTPTTFNTSGKENYLVDLPTNAVPAGALGLAIGKVGSWLLQLELSALQAEGRGEIVSNPRVITADQKEAVIEQGEDIPYEVATSSGATSITFKKAVLSLKVVPQITPDDRVMMNLKVSKDSRGADTRAGPAINTQNVSTQVLVNNGETVVLGGVFEQTNTKDVKRVPFFSDLPYVGALFKNDGVVRNKKELLIFVTPKVLKDSLRQISQAQ
jgi:type IV pilus assembly protein PilQ